MKKENKFWKEIEDNCINPEYAIIKGYKHSIISIKLFNEICSKYQVELRIMTDHDFKDISHIKNHENIYFKPDGRFISSKNIETDTIYIPCNQFKEIISKNENIYPNLITHANDFSIERILDKEYYRIWWD